MWLDTTIRVVHDRVMAQADIQRLGKEIVQLGTRALPYGDLHRAITDRVRRVMPIDAACWHGLDPDTVLLTTTANPVELFANGFLTAETEMVAAGSVLASEYQRDDVNTFASLAGRRRPSAILSETTRGRPERSARYNDYLAPFGLPHEMRTALVTRGRVWAGGDLPPDGGHRRLPAGRRRVDGQAFATDRRSPAELRALRCGASGRAARSGAAGARCHRRDRVLDPWHGRVA